MKKNLFLILLSATSLSISVCKGQVAPLFKEDFENAGTYLSFDNTFLQPHGLYPSLTAEQGFSFTVCRGPFNAPIPAYSGSCAYSGHQVATSPAVNNWATYTVDQKDGYGDCNGQSYGYSSLETEQMHGKYFMGAALLTSSRSHSCVNEIVYTNPNIPATTVGNQYRLSFRCKDLAASTRSIQPNAIAFTCRYFLDGAPINNTPVIIQGGDGTLVESVVFNGQIPESYVGTSDLYIELAPAPGYEDVEGGIAYFGIDDIVLEKCIAPDAPIVPNAVVCPNNPCQNSPIPTTLTVTNPVIGTTYEWFDDQKNTLFNALYDQAQQVAAYTTPPLSTSKIYYVRAKTPCGTSPYTTVKVTVPPQTITELFREDFRGPSVVEVTPGVFKWADNPTNNNNISPNYNGQNPNSASLNFNTVLECANPGGYFIGSSLQGWASGSSSFSGPCFNDVNSASLPGSPNSPRTRCLIGAYSTPPATLPLSIHNRMIWQTKQHFEAGHSYRFKLKLADLAYGSENNDVKEVRFGYRVWCLPANVNSTQGYSPVAKNDRVYGTGSNALEISTPCQQYATGDYIFGVELIIPPTNLTYYDPTKIMYFALSDIVIEDLRCGIPAPTLVTAIQTCGDGQQTFTVTSPGGNSGVVMPTGAQFEWYTKVNGVRQNVVTTTARTFTVSKPTGQPYGVAATYYVDIIVPSGDQSQEVELKAIWNDAPYKPISALPPFVVLGNALTITFTGEANVDYTWQWGDNTPSPALPGTNISHTYAARGTYPITVRAVNLVTGCINNFSYNLIVSDKLCETVLPAVDLSAVKVRRDPRTGSYQFELPGCATPTVRLFDCLTGPGTAQPEVVAASAIALAVPAAQPAPTYRLDAAALAENPFLAGARRLRPQATYAYSTPVEATATKSYEVGRFALTPFNWTSSAQHRLPAWQPGGQATRFSPDGEAVEEQDLLGIYSCVQLGYRAHALPYLTAKNARFSQVLFEGCETMYAAPRPDEYGRLVAALTGENGYAVAATEARLETGYAHSGTQCLALTSRAGVSTLTLPAFAARDFAQPLQLKLWLRVSHAATPAKALGRATVLAGQVGATPVLAVAWASGQSTPARVVAQSGEWLLCEATSPPGLATAGPTSYAPQLVCIGPAERQLWVDDVRLQPAQAQMTCYVYEPATFRLLASFDDQHFGLYYQYNAEGKLVRKQVETERGLQTIQETQYNAPNP